MALDQGHKISDAELRKLEKKLEKEYTQALKEMQKKTDAYFSRFKADDAKKLAQLKAGKITQDEYNKWRTNHMLTGERYNRFIDSLAQDLTHTNEIAMSMLNPTLKSAWAENYNYGGYEIAQGLNINIAWELVDHDTIERLIKDNPKLLPKPRVDIPKDKRWNQQKLRSALTQGILQGESINHIADRLKSVTDMSTSAAIRNARTATTGAENAGRQKSYDDAQEYLGIEMRKQWVSTLDDRTRESHVKLDLEIAETDEKFSNGLMYPGDPNGAPEEVYNCRCTMIGVLKKHHYKMDNRANKLGDMTYEEWKHFQKTQEKEDTIFTIFDDNIEDVSKWFDMNSNQARWRLDLISDAEKEALKDYTEDSAKYINADLYSGTHNAKADLIESALNKFELNEGIQVVRESDFRIFNDASSVSDIKQYLKKHNNIVENKAFLSFSADTMGVQNQGAGTGLRIKLDVTPNKGMGAYLGRISRLESEQEYLVNLNTQLEFDPDSIIKNGNTIEITAKLKKLKKN